MAFLSSFRIGQQTVYPEGLHERLKSFALLENVGDAALRNLLAEANWFALPGGTLLERDGDNNVALFLVVTGSLGVFVSDEQGQRQMVAHIPAGETVGEMSLIAGSSNHSAQLVALRDTELLRISPDGFEALIARHPRVMMNLMQMLVKRLKDANRGRSPKSQPRTFAIVPLHEGLSEVPIAQRLTNALAGMGRRAAVLDASASEQTAEWFNNFEHAHDIVFYRGDAPDSPWTHLCLRQADRIFLLARANQPLPLAPLSLPAFKARASGLPELLLLHPDGASSVLPDDFSVRSGLFQAHHHLRAGHQADVARLGRFLSCDLCQVSSLQLVSDCANVQSVTSWLQLRGGKAVSSLSIAHHCDCDCRTISLGAHQHPFHQTFFLRANLPRQRDTRRARRSNDTGRCEK